MCASREIFNMPFYFYSSFFSDDDDDVEADIDCFEDGILSPIICPSRGRREINGDC